MFCYHCWSEMVEITIVDRKDRKRVANVCTKCGRTISKDKSWFKVTK